MGSKQEASLDKEAHEESKFVIGLGSTLATWGLGLTLLLMSNFASEALGALPLILIPLSIAAITYASHSQNIDKREDASQILLIAFSGILISSQILSTYYFFSLSVLIAVICSIDRKLLIEPAPIGISALFVVALAPADPSGTSAFVYCLTTAITLVYFSKERRDIATSAIPIIASLILAFRTREINSLQQMIIAITFAFLVIGRFHRRFSLKSRITERRSMLDASLLLFSISLMLTAWGIVAYKKYLALAIVFGAASLILRITPEIFRFRSTDRLGEVRSPDWLQHLEPKLSNAILATATLSTAIAISAWPLGDEPITATTIRVLLFLALAVSTNLAGNFMAAPIMRDASKLYALYSAYSSLRAYLNDTLVPASNLAFSFFTLLSYATIAAVMILAGRDLYYGNGAAWQSIFSGRALVRLRSARSGAFEILTKAPFIGWIFALADKTLSRLVGSFGDAKIWTLSHYAICTSIFLGFFISISACSQFIVKRVPDFADAIAIGADAQKAEVFVTGISRIFAVLLFSAVLFFVGARLQRGYIRVLAVAVGGLLLIALAFTSIFLDKTAVIVWYYPMAFCCSFAVFRMLWTQNKSNPKRVRDA